VGKPRRSVDDFRTPRPVAPSLHVRPHVIVELIEGERPIDNGLVRTLGIACSRWQETH